MKKFSVKLEEDRDGEVFFTIPEEIVDSFSLKEGDEVEWIDLKNGSFELKFKKI